MNESTILEVFDTEQHYEILELFNEYCIAQITPEDFSSIGLED